jgi:hypothetical protein
LHIVCVVDTPSQLGGLTKIIDANAESFLLSRTLGVLEKVLFIPVIDTLWAVGLNMRWRPRWRPGWRTLAIWIFARMMLLAVLLAGESSVTRRARGRAVA